MNDASLPILSPCPFCGCVDLRIHVKRFNNVNVKLRTVECNKCGACGPPHVDINVEDQTERFWNGRCLNRT